MTAYPTALLDHYRHPIHRGRLGDADATQHVTNPLCGDEVTMDVRLRGDTVAAARFEAVGCAICIGAADIVAGAAEGQTTAEVTAWDREWVEARIGMRPPEGRRRCAMLALEALQGALAGAGA